MSLEACLPPELRTPTTTITRIAAGLSGAGVYRVEADGRAFVLKVSADDEPLGAWRRRVHLLELAADAGVAPAVVHVDPARRAVVSAFVVDRSFLAWFSDPRTREAAIALLARTVRRAHDLPVPADAEARDPHALVTRLWAEAPAGFALPGFAGDAVRRLLDEDPPVRERAPVLSHNDVNPTNIAYDGERILLLDWDTAGPNDPYYDLAAIAVFLRLDDVTCLHLLSAYDGEAVAALPARFAYGRRLVAVACGAIFLHLARTGGHAGAAGDETVATTPSLGEIYQRMRAGALDAATADGQWQLGLALLKDSLAF